MAFLLARIRPFLSPFHLLNVKPKPIKIPATATPFQLSSSSIHPISPGQYLSKLPGHLCTCGVPRHISATIFFIIINGLLEDQSVVRDIIKNCAASGDPSLAVSLYSSASEQTLFLRNWTLRCLSQYGFHSEALSLFAGSTDLPSDNFTFPVVIKASAALSGFPAGKELHCAVLRQGYGGNLGIQTSLVDGYAKSGLMDYAARVFDGMPDRDLVAWNALIFGYSLNRFDDEGINAFIQMLGSGLTPNSSTLVSIIPSFCRVGKLGVGKSLHSSAIKCGAMNDEALVPTLISMYSGFEDLCSARMLFEAMPADLVTWNSLIASYMQNGMPCDALMVFHLMRSSDIIPNFVTLLSVLPSCVDLCSIFHGESIHNISVKFGLAAQVSVVSALVSMYSKLDELQAAEYLFHSNQEKTLVLYNSMMSGYLLNGLGHMCLSSFRLMQNDGILPDTISLVSAISGCGMNQDLNSGKSMHAYSIKNSLDSKVNVVNALLSFYTDCNLPTTCLKLFHRMHEKNVISWNILISALLKMGDKYGSVASFCRMRQEGCKFDAVTVINILPSFCIIEDFVHGISFHGLVIKTGHDADIPLTNALICMYGHFGDVKLSQLLFRNLPIKSIVSWNSLMTAYRNYNLYQEVLSLFDQMRMDGHKANSITLLNLLPACGNQLEVKSIHAYATRNFSSLEFPFLTSSLCMYSRFENLSYCRMIFDMVDKANIVSWNAMMSAYCQRRYSEEAIFLFQQMLRIGPEPDPVTILALISAYSQIGRLDLAKCLIGYVVRKGFNNNTLVCNSLIDTLGRCGSISTAKELFDSLEAKDSITYSVMINGYAIHGNAEASLGLFFAMQEAHMEPDDVTFVSVLSACSHAGLVEQGRRVFDSMLKKHGYTPRLEHYACIIDLLGRTGHLGEAYDILLKLPFVPSASLLESLLGACNSYEETEIGEEIGKLLLKLNPESPSSYVVLSNLHSAAGRWIDSETLRSDMDTRGWRKDPGFSLIVAQ